MLNLEPVTLLVSVFLFLGGLGAYRLLSQWLARQPMTSEEQMTKALQDRNTTIEALLDTISKQNSKIEALESRLMRAEYRIKELEAEKAAREGKAPPYKPRKLDAEQLKALRAAMLDCFPQPEDWQMLVKDIGYDLPVIALGGNLETLAGKVLDTANRRGWIVQLMTEAGSQRLQQAAFQQLIDRLLKALEL